MAANENRFKGRLLLEKDGVSFLGGSRLDLLEAIGATGSITQAAKSVGMSYRGAWDAVDSMNNQSDQALVERTAGGKQGGGTRLTEHGRRIVNLFRAIEGEYQQTLNTMIGNIENFDEFQRLLQKFSFTTSARNQFVGRITRMTEEAVNASVHIRIDADNEIIAAITAESRKTMGLAVGVEVYALFKAGTVFITTDLNGQTSLENRFCGNVLRIHKGSVNTEITVGLESGKTVAAVISSESSQKIGLAAGMPVCALFNASNVILALVQ
ncbi:MAG TPA: TOBE domain-containing protein [Burkholderiales bacterium]|nr:TOBE domain-containing protein [Burkholderiales bacterium]